MVNDVRRTLFLQQARSRPHAVCGTPCLNSPAPGSAKRLPFGPAAVSAAPNGSHLGEPGPRRHWTALVWGSRGVGGAGRLPFGSDEAAAGLNEARFGLPRLRQGETALICESRVLGRVRRGPFGAAFSPWAPMKSKMLKTALKPWVVRGWLIVKSCRTSARRGVLGANRPV